MWAAGRAAAGRAPAVVELAVLLLQAVLALEAVVPLPAGLVAVRLQCCGDTSPLCALARVSAS